MKTLRLAALSLVLAGSATAGFDPDRLAGMKARSIGPAGMSGRIAAIEALESDPDIVYAGAATGGVWKSTNGGLTWEPMFDDQPVHAIGAIAIYPGEPGHRLGRHRRRQRPQQRLGRQRRSTARSTAARPGRTSASRRPSASTGSLLHPDEPGHRLGLRAGPGVGRERRARRLQDRRRRQELEEGALRRREDGLRRPGDGPGATRTSCSRRCGSSGAGRSSSSRAARARASTSRTTAARPGRSCRRRTACPKGELGRIGLAISPSNPKIVYALVEAEKSALLRSERRRPQLQDRQRRAQRRPAARSTSATCASTRSDPNRRLQPRLQPAGLRRRRQELRPLPGATWAQIHGDHHAMWIDPSDPAPHVRRQRRRRRR